MEGVLAAIGVGAVGARLYEILLTEPSMLLASLADRVPDLDNDLIAAGLTDLISHGLVTGPTPDGEYLARSPEEAIGTLLADAEADIDERRRALTRARGVLPELVGAYLRGHQGPAGHLVEVLASASTVRTRVGDLLAGASEIRRVVPPQAMTGDPSAARLDSDIAAAIRGATVRLVVPRTVLESDPWRARLRELVAAGGFVRVHPDPPLQTLVIDHTAAVVPESDVSRVAYLLLGSALTRPILTLVDQAWAAAVPFIDLDDDEPLAEGSSARARDVTALLAQGLTDEAIGHRLGVSVRTVRRLVAQAMHLLGAQSRFQAGVLAAQHGWVDGGGPTEP